MRQGSFSYPYEEVQSVYSETPAERTRENVQYDSNSNEFFKQINQKIRKNYTYKLTNYLFC